MGVRRQCTSDAQPVRSGLLLADAPLVRRPLLRVHQMAHQLGPLDSRLDVDQTAGGVEAEHPLHRPHVDERRFAAELLPSHGVPAARNTQRAALLAGAPDELHHRVGRGRLHDPVHPRGIELRVDVVDEDAGRGPFPAAVGRQGDRRPGLEELTSCQHGGSASQETGATGPAPG